MSVLLGLLFLFCPICFSQFLIIIELYSCGLPVFDRHKFKIQYIIAGCSSILVSTVLGGGTEGALEPRSLRPLWTT